MIPLRSTPLAASRRGVERNNRASAAAAIEKRSARKSTGETSASAFLTRTKVVPHTRATAASPRSAEEEDPVRPRTIIESRGRRAAGKAGGISAKGLWACRRGGTTRYGCARLRLVHRP